MSELTPSDTSSNAKDSSGPVCKIRRLENPEEIERISQNLIKEYLGHKNLEVCAFVCEHMLFPS